MKKSIFAIMAVLTVFALVMTGCDTGSSPSKPKEGSPATIKFDANGGTGTAPAAMPGVVGGTIALPGAGDLEKTGFIFGGWSESKNKEPYFQAGTSYTIKKSQPLYAVWIVPGEPATVTYDANGGTGTVPSAVTDKKTGDTITLATKGNLTKTDSVFGGWSEKQTGENPIPAGSSYVITKTVVTLYAVWTTGGTSPATVTFDANGGTGTVPAAITDKYIGDTIPLPAQGDLAKSGFSFQGWNESATATTGSKGNYQIPRATVTLYAVWTANNNTTLTSIKIGDVEKNALAGKDTVAEAAANLAEISLTNGTGTVTLNYPNTFLGKAQIAKVAKGGSASAEFADYVATTSYTFTDGDEIYVKMTAQDTTTVKYYGFEIGIGRDATPEKVTFDDQEPDELGTPKPALADAVAGHIMMLKAQTAKGFTVTVTKKTGQTVSFGKVNNTTPTNETGWSDAAKDIFFNAGEFLGVKVVSANGNVTNYYKISVELQPTMDIAFGTPKLYNTTEKTDKDYVDTLWNAIQWVPIANVNRAETNEGFQNNPTTSGKAKVYWDADGLWLYVDVTTQNISTNTGYEHDGSSVELFINERTNDAGEPLGTTGGNAFANGGQYRLDSNGATSGDPSAAVTDFNTLDKYKTWKTSGGYAVMFQAPWRVTDTYPIKDGKKIGLEIQINAANNDKTARIAVLKWYNTTGNTYQNSTVLAPATLKLGGATLPLQKPAITTQPENKQVPIGTAIPALTVVAQPPEGVTTLSYKWYKAASATGFEGATEVGTDSASYTPVDLNTAVADFFYYVVVTATKGTETSTATSTMARIQIYDPAVTAVTIELVTSSHPNWNATENALVFESAAGWGGGASNTYNEITDTTTRFVVPTNVTAEKYARVEVVFSAFAGTTSITNNGGQWNQDLGPTLSDGTTGQDWGRNASRGPSSTGTPLVITSQWDINTSWSTMNFSAGTGYISLNAMNKTNGVNTESGATLGVGTITKFVIKSVKLVVRQ